MFVIVIAYRAQVGKEKSLVALWDAARNQETQLCLDRVLLAEVDQPGEFCEITRYEGESAAWAAAETPAYRERYAQLAGLVENGPIVRYYHVLEAGLSPETHPVL